MTNPLSDLSRLDAATLDGLTSAISSHAGAIRFAATSSIKSDEVRWADIHKSLAQLVADVGLLDTLLCKPSDETRSFVLSAE